MLKFNRTNYGRSHGQPTHTQCHQSNKNTILNIIQSTLRFTQVQSQISHESTEWDDQYQVQWSRRSHVRLPFYRLLQKSNCHRIKIRKVSWSLLLLRSTQEYRNRTSPRKWIQTVPRNLPLQNHHSDPTRNQTPSQTRKLQEIQLKFPQAVRRLITSILSYQYIAIVISHINKFL